MLIPITEVLVYIGGTLRSRHEVEPGEYTIGRDPDCDIPIHANLVASQHARLTVNYQEWLIENLDGSDSTLINGEPLASRTQRVWPSQTIGIGKATLELRSVAPRDPDASLPPTIQVIRGQLPPEILRDRRYQIVKPVAQGGMGEILDAIDLPTERSVAMKVMLDQGDGSDVERFIREAKVTAQLEHPNIVPVHDLSVDEQNRVFYTMKFVRGVTLRKVLELLDLGDVTTLQKYPLAALLTIFQKVCDAVAFAHSRGVIHRDLKPENVMLGDFGEVLVMDWGLAKLRGEAAQLGINHARIPRSSEPATSLTMPGAILGSLRYMAPEQARGAVDSLDTRSDVYSLGAILFHIVTLRYSVNGKTVAEVADKVGRGEIESLQRPGGKPLLHLPGKRIPDSLAAVVRKAMALEQEDRYQSVAALQADVTAYQSGFATSAENAGAWKQLRLLVQRHRIVTTAVACSLVLIGVISALYLIGVISARNHATLQFERAEAASQRMGEALTIANQAREETALALDDATKANRKSAEALAKETAERLNKEQALARLVKTAPVFFDLARTHAEKAQYQDALEKLESAVDLDPKNAGYHLLRGHQFQATEQMAEAAAAYRKVLELQPDPSVQSAARTNLDLCEALLREAPPGTPLTAATRGKLYAAIFRQGRVTDLVEMEKKMAGPRRTARREIETGLSTLVRYPGFGQWTVRLQELANGSFRLNLSGLALAEVPSLAAFPVTELILDGSSVVSLNSLRRSRLEKLSANTTAIRDLAPLAGLPLSDLSLRGTQVTSLAPLSKLPLQRLVIGATAVTDLAPLAGLPLEEFVADSTDLRDISVVRTLPKLKRVSLRNCPALADLSPLHACRTLEALIITPQQNVDLLGIRSLPNLRQMSDQNRFLDSSGTVRFDLVPAAGLFWEVRGLTNSEVERLRKALASLVPRGLAPAKPLFLTPTDEKDGRFELNVQSCPEVDLNALRGLPIAKLQAYGVAIADFSPLVDTPIVDLEIGGRSPMKPVLQDFRTLQKLTTLQHLSIIDSPFADLRLLDGLQLKSLNIAATAVTDLFPLLKMPLLERLDFTKTAVTNIAPILKMPSLKEVGVPEDVHEAVPRAKQNEWLLWGAKNKVAPPRTRRRSN